MSKTLTLVSAGAPASLTQAATALIAKVTASAVKVQPSTVAASAPAVVVGTAGPASGVFCSVVQPSGAAPAPYAGVKTAVVRALLPRDGVIPVRDALDVWPASGISSAEEVAAAKQHFTKAATVAAQLAKAQGGSARVTVVTKPAAKYAKLNELFVAAATEAAAAAGATVEVINTQRAANELVNFPEKHTVVLLNDDPIAENIQAAYAGVLGGVPAVYHTLSGAQVSGGHSYKSVALAVARELKAMGLAKEAETLETAANKADPRQIVNAV